MQGPKGKLETRIPVGITMEQKDAHLIATRENDSLSALHGLARALVNNAVDGVTKGWSRELEIVGLIAAAYRNREIAEKFSITECTVKSHVTHIFDKLGLSNRLELALFAMHHHLMG